MRQPIKWPLAIEPVYSSQSGNDAISLYKGTLEVERGSHKIQGDGVIRLEWLPTPHISFAVNGLPLSNKLDLGNIVLRMVKGREAINAILTSNNLVAVSGRFSSLEIGEGSSLSTCVFHLPNFHDYLGSAVKYASKRSVQRARVTLEANGWIVTIDEHPSADKNLWEALKSSAGYGITHVGKIQKTDGQTFSSEELRNLLGSLAYFLSFCRGIWVAPLLPVGFDKDGTRQWEEWRDWPLERWQTVSTWCNLLSTECLSGSFPGFIRRLSNEVWAEPIRLSMWWYMASNMRAGGLEGSLVLAQAAFELLAWTYLVEEAKVLSKKGFEDLPASDKLRLVLSSAKIKLAIPATLHELHKLSVSASWQDGPHALTEMRNSLVHPLPKKRRKVLDADPVAVYEAASLALWYLELLLLWLFEYRGQYSNRLMRNVYRGEEVEAVPWVTT